MTKLLEKAFEEASKLPEVDQDALAKRIHATRPIFSVRINIDYRVVGFLEEDEITWFWIGSHREYETRKN